MGLDELVESKKPGEPEDGSSDRTESASETTSETQSEEETSDSNKEDEVKLVRFGQEPNQVAFKPEKWERVKQYIRTRMAMSVSSALKKGETETYNILTEAAKKVGADLSQEPDTFKPRDECGICGKRCTEAKVIIRGEQFHSYHTAEQVSIYFHEKHKGEQ